VKAVPEFLLFTLWAPLGSMGEIAVGERRTGFDRPAKSAVIGLLAAALGIERREEERLAALARGYGLAVRTDREGSILYDYHTAQVPSARRGVRWPTRRDELAEPELNTILSKREYRETPCCTVALWARAEAPEGLDTLARALERPRFTLYFGRKACPLGVPPTPMRIEAADLGAAFAAYDGQLSEPLRRLVRRLGRSEAPPRVHLDHGAEVPLGPHLRRRRIERRRDEPLSRRRWQFGLRDELVAEAVVPVP
jgi:CRISPR system Cascade subunit CasD